MILSGEWSKQLISGGLCAAVLVCSTIGFAQERGITFRTSAVQGPEGVPTWWKDRGLTDEAKPQANKSVVNVGQLKWATRQMYDELSSILPPEAEIFDAEEIVHGSPSALDVVMPYEEGSAQWKINNSLAATIGQLKNSTVRFYDKLHDISPAWVSDQLVRNGLPNDGRTYPWTGTTADDANKAPVTIGQLKNVFSLRLRESLDDDLLPDLFEHALIRYLPEFAGKNIEDITWQPGDTVVSIKSASGAPVRTNVPVPNFGGPNSNVLSASSLLAEHQAVGSVGGVFSVSGEGAANYNIPLKIPKGTSGMEPEISIGYSSAGGNGSLGVGFDITGFERISRGPTSRAKDGFFSPVNFDANDRFFFNGELLIGIRNANGDPATEADYGKDGTVYQTEANSFARIVSHGQAGSGPHHWTIQTKAGLTIELGNCATSCVVASNNPGALVWNVNRVSDNVGNYYKVEYQLDANGGPMDYRIARVKYTGNGSTAPYNEVQFIWEDRLDIAESFIQGIKIRNGKRLARVDVLGLTQLLHSYNFGYAPYHAKNSPSRLISVTQSLPGGASLPPTVIDWNSDSVEPSTGDRAIWFKSSKAEFNQVQWNSGENQLSNLIDMNGDGLLDKVSYFNADKPDSYINGVENESYYGIWVALNNGSGFDEQTMWFKPMQPLLNYSPLPNPPINYRALSAHYSYPKYEEHAGFYDVNGDGLPDRVMDLNVSHLDFAKIVRVYDGSGDYDLEMEYNPSSLGIWVALNTGDGFGELKRWCDESAEMFGAGILQWRDGVSVVATFVDMNGDGLPDRINSYDFPSNTSGFYVRLNTGEGFGPKILWGNSVKMQENHTTWGSGDSIYSGLIDMNGDGLPDKVDHYNYQNPSQGYGIYVSLNDGVGSFGAKQKWLAVTKNEQAFFSWGEHSGFFDINRDGLPDRIDHYDYTTNTPGIWISINTGSGFLPKQKWLADADSNYCKIAYYGSSGESYAGFFDMNGDGLADRVRFMNGGAEGTGLYVALNKGSFQGGSGFGAYTKWFDSPVTAANYPSWGAGTTQYAGFIDMDGDGLLDRVMNVNPATGQASGNMWVAINNGSGFDEGQPAPGFPASGALQKARVWYSSQKTEQGYAGWGDFSQMVDLDGDGLLDRIDHHNYQPDRPANQPASAMWVSLNKGRGFNERSTGRVPQPMVRRITDGMGAEIKIEYKRGSRTDLDDWGRRVYTKPAYDAAEAAAGIINVQGAGYLVSRYAEQDGLGGYRWKRHYYGGRKVERLNEKDLGFGWIETVDEQRMKGEIATYYQQFPFQGLSKEVVSYLRSGGQNVVLSRRTSTYSKHADVSGIGGKIRFVHLQGNVDYIYAPEGPHTAVPGPIGVPTASGFVGNLLSWTSTTNGSFDSYGNLLEGSSVTSDGFSTINTNVYDPAVISPNPEDPSVSRWILGRLRSAVVTTSGPAGYQPITKTSEFDYYTDGPHEGMLKSEIAEPADSSAVRKSYAYDTWGNKVAITLTALNGDQPPRTTYSKYGPTGRFVIEEWNGLGHKVFHKYDEARSLLLSSTDANGLTSEVFYDAWGTKILSRGADGTETAEITRLAGAGDIPAGTGLGPQIAFIRKSQATGSAATTAFIDRQGRVLMNAAEGFDGRISYSRTDYDVFGRQWRQSLPFFLGDPLRWSSVEFDNANRPLVNHNPGGGHSSISYQGFTTVITNEKGQTQTSIENAQGWLIRTMDDVGNLTEFTYRVDGKPKQTAAPGNHTVDVTLDIFGNKRSMTDSDVGTSSTDHYAYGEIRKNTDARNATTEFTYDLLGRQKTRLVKDVNGSVDCLTIWTYDSAPGAGKGKVHAVVMKDGSNNVISSTSYRYDLLGRLIETAVSKFGETFLSSVSYDALGRPRTETDAGGLSIIHEYDGRGFEVGIRNRLSGELYWKPLEYDAAGRLVREELGNGVINQQEFDQDRGNLLGTRSSKGTMGVQHMSYEWDVLGNFKKRTDLLQSLSEEFQYDSLNRLTSSQVSGRSALSYGYSPAGNLTSKTNVGGYTYDIVRTHAIASIAGTNGVNRTFEYDANGSLTHERRDGQIYREISWATHPNVKSLKVHGGPRLLRVDGSEIFASGETRTDFDYDSSLGRSRKVTERDQLNRETTLYLGSYERVITEIRATTGAAYALQKVEHRHNIGGLALKTFVERGGSLLEETLYYLKDHLGSISAILDHNGILKERYSFDAWGARRDAATWSDSRYDQLTKVSLTNRGYTGHEMLDEIGLVHMNGRIYDPELGRVLSGDPVVQEPENSQNYNRYTYVVNNPLTLTDPSGFFFLGKKIFDAKKKLHSKINEHRKSIKRKVTKWLAENEWAAIVVTIVVGIVTMGIGVAVAAGISIGTTLGAMVGIGAVSFTTIVSGLSFAAGLVAGALGGFLAGGVNAALAGGDWGDILKGAFIGGMQGAASAGIGHSTFFGPNGAFGRAYQAAKVAAHGVLGGSVNAAMGGKFADGFLSAAAAKGAAMVPGLGDYMNPLIGEGQGITIFGRTALAAVIGGTASSIGGGKFLNGAKTAAFQHLFNGELEGLISRTKHFFHERIDSDLIEAFAVDKSQADNKTPDGKYFRVSAHGNSAAISVDRYGPSRSMFAKELADWIRGDSRWAGRSIWLYACNAGGLSYNPEGNFAQQLANELRVNVMAPNSYLAVAADGPARYSWEPPIYKIRFVKADFKNDDPKGAWILHSPK